MSCSECRCYGNGHHPGCPNAPEPPKCICGHDAEAHPRQPPEKAGSASHLRPRGPCIECGPAPTNDPSGHSDEPLCTGYDPKEDDEEPPGDDDDEDDEYQDDDGEGSA